MRHLGLPALAGSILLPLSEAFAQATGHFLMPEAAG